MDKLFPNSEVDIDKLYELALKKFEAQKDTNNYICRDTNKLPERDTDIYKDIEYFKSYELTYCVAYEMAIRNKEIVHKIENYLVNPEKPIFRIV